MGCRRSEPLNAASVDGSHRLFLLGDVSLLSTPGVTLSSIAVGRDCVAPRDLHDRFIDHVVAEQAGSGFNEACTAPAALARRCQQRMTLPRVHAADGGTILLRLVTALAPIVLRDAMTTAS